MSSEQPIDLAALRADEERIARFRTSDDHDNAKQILDLFCPQDET